MKFDEKTSKETAQNWLNGLVTALEKEDYLLEVLLDKNKLQPNDAMIIKDAKNKLLALLAEIDELKEYHNDIK
jgi:hypothetical protein